MIRKDHSQGVTLVQRQDWGGAGKGSPGRKVWNLRTGHERAWSLAVCQAPQLIYPFCG